MVSLVSLFKLNLFSMCSYNVIPLTKYFNLNCILPQLPLQTSQYFFRCVGKVIDNNDDAALLEEREELVERQDLGMRRSKGLTHCVQIYSCLN